MHLVGAAQRIAARPGWSCPPSQWFIIPSPPGGGRASGCGARPRRLRARRGRWCRPARRYGAWTACALRWALAPRSVRRRRIHRQPHAPKRHPRRSQFGAASRRRHPPDTDSPRPSCPPNQIAPTTTTRSLSAGLRGRRRARTAGGHLRRPRRPRLHHAGRGRRPHQRVPRPRLRSHRHRRLRRQGQRQAGAGQVPLMSFSFSLAVVLISLCRRLSLPRSPLPLKRALHRDTRDATWPGLAWHDATWPGLAWHDATWPGLAWHGMTWRGVA